MPEAQVSMHVRIPLDGVAVVDIKGEITRFAEGVIADAYDEATRRGASSLLLNFGDLDYMNSSGIGLLVTLLVRTQRNGQHLGAFGLSEHYAEILELTRLDEAITVHSDETAAIRAFTEGTS
jgi:anti-sigma B factor antagonist